MAIEWVSGVLWAFPSLLFFFFFFISAVYLGRLGHDVFASRPSRHVHVFDCFVSQ